MRLVRLTCALAAVSLIACGGGGGDDGGGDGDGGNGMGGSSDYVSVSGIEPDHGPLPGGNVAIVSGSGFTRVSAAPNMLLIGGRIALDVDVLSDTELAVTMPAGMTDGPVDVTLFNNNGTVSLDDAYSYNPLPTITGLNPDNGEFDGGDTVQITGTGFQALEAGTNTVWFGETEAVITSVDSDTQVTVTTPMGLPGLTELVSVENANGGASYDGFLYTTDDVLTLGRLANISAGEVMNIDTGTATVTSLRAGTFDINISSAVVTPDGFYVLGRRGEKMWKLSSGGAQELGRVEGCARSVQSLAWHDNQVYAYCKSNGETERFGTFDTATGLFTPLGGSAEWSGGASLASDGTTLYLVTGSNVYQVNTGDGTLTNNQVHTLSSVRGAAFAEGTLYVITKGLAGKGGSPVYTLRTLDPATGATTQIGLVPGDVHSLLSPN